LSHLLNGKKISRSIAKYAITPAFQQWKTNDHAKNWIKQLGYTAASIKELQAKIIKGSHKADIKLTVNGSRNFHIQLKLISSDKGFNQIDKRWLKTYQTKWNIPEDTHRLLQYFTGEKLPYKKNSKDSRRMFLSELTDKEQQGVIQFFSKHKTNIITELFQGSEEIKPDWFMVIQKSETYNRTVLKPIDKIIAHYEQGAVKLSPRGSLEIGKVKMQRKGGDNGRPTANMLQFKIDPVEIFNIDEHKKSPE